MNLVEKILTQFPRLLLIIGSANKSKTSKNPWTLEEREEMIRASIPLELQKNIDIAGLDDVKDDDIWCENLQRLTMKDKQITVFTGNEWVKSICERHNIQTEWIQYSIDISGSEIRDMMKKSEDVRKYILFDPQNYFI